MPLTLRALRVLGACALLAFFTLAFTPLAAAVNRSFAVHPVVAPAAAIVVLGGGGVHTDGSLTDVSLRRTLHGIDLFQRGLAPLLVLSGPQLEPTGPSEGEVRSALARRLGVPAQAIVTETAARTTREEAIRIAARLRPQGVARILLVADAQGMRRAIGVFQRAGLESLPAPADDVSGSPSSPTARLAVAQRLAMELMALAYYRAAGYL